MSISARSILFPICFKSDLKLNETFLGTDEEIAVKENQENEAAVIEGKQWNQ